MSGTHLKCSRKSCGQYCDTYNNQLRNVYCDWCNSIQEIDVIMIPLQNQNTWIREQKDKDNA